MLCYAMVEVLRVASGQHHHAMLVVGSVSSRHANITMLCSSWEVLRVASSLLHVDGQYLSCPTTGGRVIYLRTGIGWLRRSQSFAPAQCVVLRASARRHLQRRETFLIMLPPHLSAP